MSQLNSLRTSASAFFGAFFICVVPAAAQVQIDFELGAPSVFAATIPLTTEYAQLGVVFSGSQQNTGGCVLNQASNFGMDARSGTDFLAFAGAATNSAGGGCGGPVHMDFADPVSSLSIYGAGGANGGAAIYTMNAYSGGMLVASTTVPGVAGNVYVEISLSDMVPPADRVTLRETSGKTGWAFDDLTFEIQPSLVPFCFGDGSGSTCPCGNSTVGLGGCSNSSGSGAIALADGTPSLASDALTITAANLLPSTSALLFGGTQENNMGNGSFFGDGLLCVAGPITRLGVKVASPTGEAVWGPGILSSLVGAQAGDSRTFQVWYRDPAGFPCGSGFNLSNGLQGVLQP